MGIDYKKIRWSGEKRLDICSCDYANGARVPILMSKRIKSYSGVKHCFSTREGGVSRGFYESMNLSFSRGDAAECVLENYRRIAECLGGSADSFVLSHQTHSSNVRAVYKEDMGKGVLRDRDYENVDALITNVPGLMLGVFWADCVPVLLFDPVKRAVGAVHSGWRGTVSRISERAVEALRDNYGSRAEDLIAVIGPSICEKCYEISEDVAERFREVFKASADKLLSPLGAEAKPGTAPDKRKEGKYLLNLWEANRLILSEAGLRNENIEIGGLCTCCNPEFLFSHRSHGDNRGNNAAFIMLES